MHSPGAPLLNGTKTSQPHSISIKNDAIQILVQPDSDPDGRLEAGGSLWYGGVALARELSAALVAGRCVLELGSGLGVPGLAAACLGAKKVYLTDLEAQLPVLRAQVELNRAAIPTEGVTVQELAFGTDHEGLHDVELVIGADIAYDPQIHPLLIKTLKWFLEQRQAKVLLCEERRWKDIFNWFLQDLKQQLAPHHRLKVTEIQQSNNFLIEIE
jgi:predicted nicotinamide N-methyase